MTQTKHTFDRASLTRCRFTALFLQLLSSFSPLAEPSSFTPYSLFYAASASTSACIPLLTLSLLYFSLPVFTSYTHPYSIYSHLRMCSSHTIRIFLKQTASAYFHLHTPPLFFNPFAAALHRLLLLLLAPASGAACSISSRCR